MATRELAPGMGGPHRYRIRVRGRMEVQWAERMNGLSAHESIDDSGVVITTLLGNLPDQTALAGVLASLFNLQLPVLSAECVDDQSPRTRNRTP